ncbi:MAG: thioesterase family protein [Acidimicrobiales bacterium]|nr:thioesterase family protein [Acidimicrobiales bacterium]
MPDALFAELGDGRFLPADAARGPWSPDALHGGPVAALLAGAAEALLEDLHPARVSIELLRPVPVAPLAVATRALRPGRKVRLIGAELATEAGAVVASATVLGIRRADVVVPANGPADAPPLVDAVETGRRAGVRLADDYDAFHNCGVEHRFVRGAFHEPGPATDWIRLQVPVVPGAEPSPLQRVMGAADFGNGISGMADFSELIFINPDLTVHLHRLPVGEWVCLDSESRLEPEGIGLAQSALWDERGPLGRSLQSLLVEAR